MNPRVPLALAALVVAGLLCARVAAQQENAAPARDAPAAIAAVGTASISGTVMSDEAEPRPVSRAVVEATNAGSFFRRQAITSPTGTFEIPELPAGRYRLSITRPGYVRLYYGARPGQREGLVMSLVDGERLRNVAARLSPAAVVTGRVTNETGHPLQGAPIFVMERRVINGTVAYQATTSPRYSDDRGIYRLYGLHAGSYLVVAGSAPTGLLGALLPLTPAQAQWAAGARTVAPPGPAGTKTFAPVFYPGTTDQSAATVVTVRAGEERSGIDFPLSLVTTSKVTGTIRRADGTAAANVQLFALTTGAELNLGDYGLFLSTPRATVDADGAFTFNTLTPGPYTLAARAASRPAAASAGSAGSVSDLWASTDLLVSGADIQDVSLVLRPGITISGRVTFEGTTAAPGPAELPKGSMRLSAPPTRGPVIRPPAGNIRADGTFSIEGVAPGRYTLSGYVPGETGDRPTWALKSVHAGGRDLLDAPMDVQPDTDIKDAVVTFTNRVSGVSGSLVDQAGQPVPEFWILVFSTSTSHWWPGSRRVHDPVRPSADGRYQVIGLPPGEYYLAAIRDFEEHEHATPEFLQQVVPGAIRIMIGEGERKTQDVRLGI